MFTAPKRRLAYPLYDQLANEVESPAGDPFCELPVFPEDSDEKITVLFRLSLNEFVSLASAVDVGSDIAFGADAIKLWILWSNAYMCASFCEEVAACLNSEDPAVVEALANLITNNQTIIQSIINSITNAGGATPGQPISEAQAASDTLPPNTKNEFDECIPDSLWGACLFLVQSGNRAITDFFEQLEAASNTLETSAIISQTIPAAGPYVTAAVEFADQIQENFAEGYAGGYTETYENELACALFCIARPGCELTPDMLIDVMAERLGYIDGTENFGTLMARIGTGVFVGAGIADSMFYIYFAALRFGQQFGDVFGFRPLTDLMSLGADQLASDNWETLCDCPVTEVYAVALFDQCGDGAYQTEPFEDSVAFELTAIEIATSGSYYLAVVLPAGQWSVTLNSITGTITPPADPSQSAYSWYDTSDVLQHVQWNAPAGPDDFGTQDVGSGSFAPWCATQGFNFVLFNEGPFSANLTAVAI